MSEKKDTSPLWYFLKSKTQAYREKKSENPNCITSYKYQSRALKSAVKHKEQSRNCQMEDTEDT